MSRLDAYGRALEVGQLVAYSEPNNRSGGGSRVGRVVGFTAQRVKLRMRPIPGPWQPRREQTMINRRPQLLTLLSDPAPPEHDFVRDVDGPKERALVCRICGTYHAEWSGDECWERDLIDA